MQAPSGPFPARFEDASNNLLITFVIQPRDLSKANGAAIALAAILDGSPNLPSRITTGPADRADRGSRSTGLRACGRQPMSKLLE